jgi:MFS family permease
MLEGVRRRFAEVAAVAPRAYWYVWWGTLINRLGGFVLPLLTIYLMTVRHLSASEAGGIVSVYGAGAIAASLTGGYLCDRLGRKITLVGSLLGGAVALGGLGLARELSAITVMTGVVGFVTELYRPAVFAIVADVVPPSHRVRAYGLLHWVINVGFAVAAVVGGLLADVNFTLLFVVDAATMAIYGVIALVCVPETRPAVRPARVDVPLAPSRSWLVDREFATYAAATLGIALIASQSTALSAHMTWQGFTPATYGAVIAVNGILIIGLQPVLSTWSARRDPTRVVTAAALLYGLGYSLHGLAGNVPLHVAAVMVWTVGEILESPTRSAITAAMAPSDARGRYQGAIAMTFGAAQLIGPKVGMWTWQHVGPGALWAGCLGLGAVVAAGLSVTGPARRRRMAGAITACRA